MGEVIGPFDVVLVLGVLFAAGFALFGRPRIHAAAMFLVFGVLLSVVWAWLSAPDVAIAEAALGAGVTGVLIMNAVTATGAAPPPGEPPSAVGTDDGDSSSEADTGRARSGSVRRGEQRTLPQRLYAIVAGVFAGVLALGLVAVVWQMRPVPGVGGEVGENLASSGVSHPVTAVLLNFRSYDTLLEIAVLAAAALGAVAIRPRGAPLPRIRRDSGPLGAMVRLVVPVLVLMVGWLLVAGSTRPGGAFQAGALLAGAALMLYMAGTDLVPRLQRWLLPLLLAGLGAFLLLAALTAAFTGGWLVLDPGWGGAVIIAVEAVLMLSIGATLTVLLVTMDRISTAALEPGERR